MNNFTTADLPIGFGLGKDEDHWYQVYKERFQTVMMESRSTDHIGEKSKTTADKRMLDSDIMSIVEVAEHLRCGVDQVRRISRAELPARNGPGRLILYLKSEVLDYVKRLPPAGRRNSGLSTSKSKTQSSKNYLPECFNVDSARKLLDEPNE